MATGRISTKITADAPGAHRTTKEAVPILMYHVIGYVKPNTPNRSLWISPRLFKAQIDALAKAGYHAVTLNAVWKAWHQGGFLPSKPIVISFDDGYFGQYRNAMPTLRTRRWPGVLNLKLNNLKDMGGASNIRRMVKNGWEIDSHTITHPDLTKISDQQLHEEIFKSKTELEKLINAPVNFFCYPVGFFNARVEAEVKKAGYLGATTTQSGLARPQDSYTLARIRVLDSDTPADLLGRLHAAKNNLTS